MKWKILRFYIVEADGKWKAREVLAKADYLGTTAHYFDGEMVKPMEEPSLLSHAGDQLKHLLFGQPKR